MSTQIFVCTHKKGNIVDTAPLVPLFIGSSEPSSPNMLRDNTQDSIAEKNPYYSELTGLYWIWKNVQADIVGLFHYRRFFNFKNDITKFHTFTKDFVRRYGITERNIEKILQTYDIILPQKTYLDPKHSSIYEHYRQFHYIEDLDIVLDVIKQRYPKMYEIADTFLKQEKQMHICNMMICSKALWDEYATWLFDILFEAEKAIQPTLSSRDSLQKRVYGFLSERLLNIFIKYKQETSGLKIKELPLLFWEEDVAVWRKYRRRYFKDKIRSFFHLSQGDKQS